MTRTCVHEHLSTISRRKCKDCRYNSKKQLVDSEFKLVQVVAGIKVKRQKLEREYTVLHKQTERWIDRDAHGS